MIEFELERRNPAEVLAACGIFNLSSSDGQAKAQFTPEGTFRLETRYDFEELLSHLRSDRIEVAGDLSSATISGFQVNWWMREGRAFKLWAGQVNPDNLIRELARACDRLREKSNGYKLLSASLPLTKRLGADPRSSWATLDIGYSPDKQGMGAVHTWPFTELLAMIGLQTFLPREIPRERERRRYDYNLWESMLPLLPARLAFAGVSIPCPVRRYRFTVGKSGSYRVFNFSELEG